MIDERERDEERETSAPEDARVVASGNENDAGVVNIVDGDGGASVQLVRVRVHVACRCASCMCAMSRVHSCT